MITTRREVNIDNGVASYAAVKRIAPEERIVSVNPEVEVGAAEPAVRIAPEFTETEFMPVVTRDDETEVKVSADERPEVENHVNLSHKAKMALCVYIACAFIVALLVLATGIALTSVNGEVVNLENEVRSQSAVLAEKQAVIDYLLEDETVAEAAKNAGMVKSDGVRAIDLIEMEEVAAPAARTNAFDRFCDFLGSIFGG